MAIIASQHRPGTPLAHDTGYTPQRPWPADCGVQWSDKVPFFRKNLPPLPHDKAFFEAFPKGQLGAYFRGEGETIEEAEGHAFARYERFNSCNHEWERAFDEYSSVGQCKCCGQRATYVFEAKLREYSSEGPLSPADLQFISMGLMRRDPKGLSQKHVEEGERKRAAIRIKAEHQGFQIPDGPEDEDAYEELCSNQVALFWLKHRAWYDEFAATLPPPAHHEPGFMNALQVGCLDGEVKELYRGKGVAQATEDVLGDFRVARLRGAEADWPALARHLYAVWAIFDRKRFPKPAAGEVIDAMTARLSTCEADGCFLDWREVAGPLREQVALPPPPPEPVDPELAALYARLEEEMAAAGEPDEEDDPSP